MPDLAIIPLGLVIGILVSAPVGPVNIICINRTLRHGFATGAAAGLGALLADGLLAAIAGFGLAAVSDALMSHDRLIQLIGGVVLVGFGLKVMSAPPPDPTADFPLDRRSPLRILAATFAITITNPGAVLGMVAIVGGAVGGPMVPEGDYAAAGLLVLSIIGGAALWWSGLAAVVSRLRHRFSARAFKGINLVSGVALTGFGLLLIGRAGLALLGYSP